MQTPTRNQDIDRAKQYFQDKMDFTTGPVELNRWREGAKEVNIVDLRAEEDFLGSHIPGAVNLPKDKWNTFEGLSNEKVNVLYCYSQTCHLAPNAAVLFADKGYPVMEMEGGFKSWENHHLPIEITKAPEPEEVVALGTHV